MSASLAAQLLNPKAAAKEKAKKRNPNYGPKQSRKPNLGTPATPTSDDVRANIPTWDPNFLLGGAKAATRGAAASNGTVSNAAYDDSRSITAEANDGEGPGMSHFMPAFQRTVNRDSVPQRKRNSESIDGEEGTPERKKPKSTFSGISKGGVISEQLKAEREKAAAEAGPANMTIDLTADDDGKDDGLVFMGEKEKLKVSEENKEVCLGVLQGKANISRIPTYATKALGAVGKDTWPRLKLDYRRSVENAQNNKIELLDRSKKVVGFMELKIAAALCPLLNGQNTNRLRLVVNLMPWPRSRSDYPGQFISKHLDLMIIIHAPRKKIQSIGKYLSQKQLFLSSPTAVGVYVGMEIENPHMPVVYGARGERRPQTSQPVVVSRDANELRREAEGMFDKMVKHEDLAEMEPDATFIKTPLLAHQKQALQFMTDHEHTHTGKEGEVPAFSLWKSDVNHRGDRIWIHLITGQEIMDKPEPVRGGILADMMGLGKTLSILSLIAHTKTEAGEFGELDPPRSLEAQRNAKTSVIICPKSVMSNWLEQIKLHVKAKKLSYYSYHGSSRRQDLDELAQYDIILTTYGTASEDMKNKSKALCNMNWFRVVLDEAHAIRNQNTHVSKACIELAADRRWAVTGTPVQNGLGDMGALVKFLRVRPFDNSHTWSSSIIVPLKSGNTDVIAHLRLLVDSITLRRLKDKIGLKGRTEIEKHLEFSESDRRIYAGIANQSSRDMMLMTGGKTAMRGKAYAHMLRLLDRMRRFCAHGIDMFNDEDRKEIEEGMNPDNAIAIDLGDDPALEAYNFVGEKQAYETLHLLNETDADRCEKCGNKLGEKQPDAEGNIDVSGDEGEETSSDRESDGSDTTKGNDVIGYLNPCFHVFCPGCKDSYVTQANESMTADQRHECSCCSAYVRFGLFEFLRSGLQEHIDSKSAKAKKRNGRKIWDNTNYSEPSAKVYALLDDLKQSAVESTELEELGEPPIRSVVFSQWTSYLDLIEVALEDNDIGFTRLDGSMSIGQRTRVLEQFKIDPNITVILVSIKAGGQGLNFTAASKVYMMEPQYNPGVEQQAIDRVHRLGQKRDVLITHYFITNTIEQKIQLLQKRKEDLARFTLERKLSKVEEARKRIEDLRDLFK